MEMGRLVNSGWNRRCLRSHSGRDPLIASAGDGVTERARTLTAAPASLAGRVRGSAGQGDNGPSYLRPPMLTSELTAIDASKTQ